jgi:hypothetical protein
MLTSGKEKSSDKHSAAEDGREIILPIRALAWGLAADGWDKFSVGFHLFSMKDWEI